MNFAERFAAIQADPSHDGADNPLYVAFALTMCPGATPAEAEQLAGLLEPPNMALIRATAEIGQES
jgi:hypothetical protein